MSRLQRVQSFESLLKKKISIFWVFFLTQSSILWIILVKKEEVQFCKSYFKKTSSTLWVFFFFSDFISLSHIRKKVQFFESIKFLKKKSSIICGKEEKVSILCGKKRKRHQFSASYSKKKVSILCVIFKEKGFNSLSHTKNQFFEPYKKSFLWAIQKNISLSQKFWSNSLSHFFFFKKKIFVIIQERSFKSGSHQNKSSSWNQVWKTKSSSLWVKSNSLSYFFKKEVQFFESFYKLSHILKRFDSLSRIEKKKGSILRVHLKKLLVNFKKSSILWVLLKKAGSILRVMWKKSILSFQKIEKFNFWLFQPKISIFESQKNGFD